MSLAGPKTVLSHELFAAVDFPRDTSEFDDISRSIQDFIELCAKEKLGFKEARDSAAAGMFEAMNDDVAGVSSEVSTLHKEECSRYLRINKSVKIAPKDIPSVAVASAIYAHLATSTKNMKVSRNDYLDVEHATVSLPYCDFATFDGPMARRLCVPPVCNHLPKSAVILGSLGELLEVLSEL